MLGFRLGNEFHQIKNYNTKLKAKERINIKIINGDVSDFECVITPDYRIDIKPGNTGTPLDIDLGKFNLKSGDYVEVSIDLVDARMRFIPDDSKGRYSVTAGSTGAIDDFWNLELNNEDPLKVGYFKSTSFLCKITDVPENSHPFNVGVLFLKANDPTFEFRVIYDPKVENDGN